jgi:large conductance mechanosensitive channel
VLKGFKDFLMRGNVVDLAVAVIIGTAFTAIVTAIADSFIKPLIAAFGGANVTGLAWTIVGGNRESTIDFAAIITAGLNFLIIAAIVYFLIVMPMKKLEERRRRGEEPGPTTPTDVELLTEIRDLLRQQQSGAQTFQQQSGAQTLQHQSLPHNSQHQQQQQRPQQPPPPSQQPRRPY